MINVPATAATVPGLGQPDREADMPKSTQWHRCTAQGEDGAFCDALAMEGAPFPICIRHGAQLLRFMRDELDKVEQAPKDIQLLVLDKAYAPRTERAVARANEPVTEKIYYVQIGEHIKIGYTINLKQRLASYPPNRRLLATEPGGERTEAQRLRQFLEYRATGREWHYPAQPLVDHINKLRVRAGANPIKRVA